jgi:hypothetical protein
VTGWRLRFPVKPMNESARDAALAAKFTKWLGDIAAALEKRSGKYRNYRQRPLDPLGCDYVPGSPGKIACMEERETNKLAIFNRQLDRKLDRPPDPDADDEPEPLDDVTDRIPVLAG